MKHLFYISSLAVSWLTYIAIYKLMPYDSPPVTPLVCSYIVAMTGMLVMVVRNPEYRQFWIIAYAIMGAMTGSLGADLYYRPND